MAYPGTLVCIRSSSRSLAKLSPSSNTKYLEILDSLVGAHFLFNGLDPDICRKFDKYLHEILRLYRIEPLHYN